MTLYREEASSMFTHLGQLYHLNTLFHETEDTPPKRIDFALVSWILEDAVIDPVRLEEADTEVPILVLHDHQEDRWIVLDGTHRVKRAEQLGLEALPYKLVTEQQLQKAKVQ